MPPVEPEAAEPLIRSQIGTIERVLARSGVWTKFESGTSTPLMSSFRSTITDGSLKRSSQTTSLATKPLGLRGEQRARSRGVLRALRAPERLREAGQAVGAELQRLDRRSWASSSGPGGSSLRARVDADLLLLGEARRAASAARRA